MLILHLCVLLFACTHVLSGERSRYVLLFVWYILTTKIKIKRNTDIHKPTISNVKTKKESILFSSSTFRALVVYTMSCLEKFVWFWNSTNRYVINVTNRNDVNVLSANHFVRNMSIKHRCVRVAALKKKWNPAQEKERKEHLNRCKSKKQPIDSM